MKGGEKERKGRGKKRNMKNNLTIIMTLMIKLIMPRDGG